MSKTPNNEKKCFICNNIIRNNTEIKIIRPIRNIYENIEHLQTIIEEDDKIVRSNSLCVEGSVISPRSPTSPTSPRLSNSIILSKPSGNKDVIYKSKKMRASKSASSVSPIKSLVANGPMLCHECYNK